MVCCWYAVSSLFFYGSTKSYILSHSFQKNSSENPNIQSPIYFNRTDVKKAINAPLDVEWTPCANINVFNTSDGGDESLPPAFTVLPSVIARNVRTVVVHGLADFDLLSDGFVSSFVLFSFFSP